MDRQRHARHIATPVGDGDLNFSASATLSYRSKTYQFEIPNPVHRSEGLRAVRREPGLHRCPSNRWSLGLHGKNLTNKEVQDVGLHLRRRQPDDRRADRDGGEWAAHALGIGHRGHADRLLRQPAPDFRDRHGEVLGCAFLSPFVSSEVEAPIGGEWPHGISTSLDANGFFVISRAPVLHPPRPSVRRRSRSGLPAHRRTRPRGETASRAPAPAGRRTPPPHR